jgi:hypothetical protein
MTMAAACAARPTRVTTTWVDPAQPSAPFHKTVAVFIGGDAALRRTIEDRLAQRLPNAVASYTLIPDDRLGDPERVRGDLMNAGFDGAVVLSLLSVESSGGNASAPSATPSDDLWEYMRRTPRIALTPGRETVITMVSRVYSVTGGRLLWAGRSESFNPLSIKELVNMLVDSAANEARNHRHFF